MHWLSEWDATDDEEEEDTFTLDDLGFWLSSISASSARVHQEKVYNSWALFRYENSSASFDIANALIVSQYTLQSRFNRWSNDRLCFTQTESRLTSMRHWVTDNGMMFLFNHKKAPV